MTEWIREMPEIKKHCQPCPRCNKDLKTVFVHGHEQCLNCGQVVVDCCQGEVCDLND
jgi:hypothetical protein